MVSVGTSCSPIEISYSPIYTSCSPIVAGVALDDKWWGVVQEFHHSITGGFFLLLLERGKCNTSSTPITPRATPTTAGDRTEQHIQPIRSKKYKEGRCKTDPDWPESEE